MKNKLKFLCQRDKETARRAILNFADSGKPSGSGKQYSYLTVHAWVNNELSKIQLQELQNHRKLALHGNIPNGNNATFEAALLRLVTAQRKARDAQKKKGP